jgi:hypothetical protein
MIIFWTLDLTYIYWCCSRVFAYNKSYFHTLSFELFANIIRWVICVVGLYVLLGCLFWWVVRAIGYLCWWVFIMVGYVCCWVVCWIVCVDGLYVLLGFVCCKVVVLCALLGCVHWLVVCVVCLYTLLSYMWCWVLYVAKLYVLCDCTWDVCGVLSFGGIYC